MSQNVPCASHAMVPPAIEFLGRAGVASCPTAVKVTSPHRPSSAGAAAPLLFPSLKHKATTTRGASCWARRVFKLKRGIDLAATGINVAALKRNALRAGHACMVNWIGERAERGREEEEQLQLAEARTRNATGRVRFRFSSARCNTHSFHLVRRHHKKWSRLHACVATESGSGQVASRENLLLTAKASTDLLAGLPPY
jgi:hypothetical protein